MNEVRENLGQKNNGNQAVGVQRRESKFCIRYEAIAFLNPRSFSFRWGPITEDSNIRPVGNFTDNPMKRLIELRRSPQGSPLLASLAK